MIKQHLKIAIRNILKYPIFSFINVSGLAIGMAAAMLLLLWVSNQFSIDNFHKNGRDIYKIYVNQKINGGIYTNPSVPDPIAQLAKNEIAEVDRTTRIIETNKFFRYGQKEIQSQGFFVDPAFLNMFSFPLIEGEKSSVLQEPNSIILSEKLAKLLFRNEDPIGKIIQADNKQGFVVNGIIKDPPSNTQFKFDFLLSYQLVSPGASNLDTWQNAVNIFVQLKPGVKISYIDKKITAVSNAHNPKIEKSAMFLYPLEKLWLHSQFENGKPKGGGIDVVRFLIIIAFVILLIAGINFVNLSTARSSNRAKEVGVRKVMGVRRISLIGQFINESIVLSFVAGIFALAIVIFALPAFNSMTEKNIQIQYHSIGFWLSFLGFVLFTGLLSGIYPAFFLSSFKPVKVLKGIFQKKRSFISPRKLLVISQFTFAVILINFTLMLQKQIEYMKEREPGFIKQNLVYHNITPDIEKNYTVIKNEMIHSGAALFVNKSNVPITRNGSLLADVQWQGKRSTEKIDFELLTSCESFIKTNGITLLNGRDIDVTNFPGDTSACLINEAALRIINAENPIGQIIKQGNTNLTIIGVIKNFITGSPMQEISPVVIRGSNEGQFLNVRLNNAYSSGQAEKTITQIVKKYNPATLTEFKFSDEDYSLKMKGIKLTAQLTYLFTTIALFISCLGLFGLVLYVIANKAKEISIRKVLGAGIPVITSLLTKDFVKLVLISILIASPISWLLMSSFLQPIYYRINLSLLILLEGSCIVLGVTIATIGGQSIKAAIRNPIKNLKEE